MVWWNKKTPLKKYQFGLFSTAIIILSLPIILTKAPFCIANFSSTGEVGDTIGGIISPFAAIIAIWFTFKAFWVQYEANESQKIINNNQRKDIAMERFENTFFQMLNLQQEIVNGLRFSLYEHEKRFNHNTQMKPEEDIIVTGRSVFNWIYNKGTYSGLKTSSGRFPEGLKGLINEYGYENYVKQPSISCLDHYFRHLYRIFKFVYDSRDVLSNKYNEEYKYTSIIRAQLSEYELILLFYNCLSPNGKDRFKKYAERYALFNNIREELLVEKKHQEKYKESAFIKEENNNPINWDE